MYGRCYILYSFLVSFSKQGALPDNANRKWYAKIMLHIMPDMDYACIYSSFTTLWDVLRPSVIPSHGKEVVADFLAAAYLSPTHAVNIDDSHDSSAVPSLIHKESL